MLEKKLISWKWMSQPFLYNGNLRNAKVNAHSFSGILFCFVYRLVSYLSSVLWCKTFTRFVILSLYILIKILIVHP